MIYVMAGIVIMCFMLCLVEGLARLFERRFGADLERRERARHYES